MFIWILAALAAYYVKGVCGFANTLVLTSLLSFGTDNINITPVDLVLGYPTNAVVAWRERRSIHWGVCLPLAALVLAGNIPGIFFLKHADSRVIKVLLGFVIILIGMELLYREVHPRKAGKQSKLLLTLIGIISGLLCGLYGIGALLSAYVSRVTDNTSAFKANICVVFFIESTFRIIVYCCFGIITFSTLKQAVILYPAAFAGLALGMWSGKHLNETLAKRVIVIVLMLSGAALVVTNLAF